MRDITVSLAINDFCYVRDGGIQIQQACYVFFTCVRTYTHTMWLWLTTTILFLVTRAARESFEFSIKYAGASPLAFPFFIMHYCHTII